MSVRHWVTTDEVEAETERLRQERDTLRNALRFLLDSIKWEDELMAWVVTANGAIGVAKDALKEGK